MGEAGFTAAGKREAPAAGASERASWSTRSTCPRRSRARPPVRGQGLPDGGAGDGRGRLGEPQAIEDEAAAVLGCRCSRRAPPPAPDVRGLVGEERRGAGERRPDPRVEALLEVGQQLVPHAVAPVRGVGVRGILAPVEARARAGARGPRPRDAEQRAHQVAAPRPHAREARSPRRRAAAAAAASRPGRRACGRPRSGGAFVVPHPAQERVALAARGLLEAAPLARGALAHSARCPPRNGTSSVSHSAAQKAASSAEPGRRPWSRCAATSRKPRRRRSEASASVSATESAPPGEADHERLAPRGSARGPQGPVDGRDEGRHPQRSGLLARGGWWRCRDSNPGLRGYEPRALTS